MGVKSRSRNRKGRLDPSKPKLPAAIAVAATIADDKVILTAAPTVVLQYDASFATEGDALPGVTVFKDPATLKATAVVIGPANVATITFSDDVAAGCVLNVSPLTQALRSNRGGVLAVGQTTF